MVWQMGLTERCKSYGYTMRRSAVIMIRLRRQVGVCVEREDLVGCGSIVFGVRTSADGAPKYLWPCNMVIGMASGKGRIAPERAAYILLFPHHNIVISIHWTPPKSPQHQTPVAQGPRRRRSLNSSTPSTSHLDSPLAPPLAQP